MSPTLTSVVIDMALTLNRFSPFSPSALILTVVCVVAVSFFTVILRFIRRNRCIREIPGPVASASWLYGNLPELLLTQPYGKHEFGWQEQYGSTYRMKGAFFENLLFTSDPTTLRYIFNDARLFDFSHYRTYSAVIVLGNESMFVMRNGGETHRRVKIAFSAAFTLARLQLYVPVIRDIARKAADKLMQQYLGEGRQSNSNRTLNVYHLLQHITSDIIGEVGFGYKFNAVETDGGDEVAQSHQDIANLGARSKFSILVENVMPHIPYSVSRLMLHLPVQASRAVLRFRTVSDAWATTLLRTSLESHDHDNDQSDKGLVGFVAATNETQNRGRLSFNEICQQTTGLLLAGQETTANAIAWALFELAKHPGWQDQIREELNDSIQDMDSRLDKLEYLNAHIKETLRFYPGAPLTERVAFEDTVLPLSQPITTTSGRVISDLPIQKGQIIHIGVGAYNRDPHVWGPDADLFQPTRWLDGRYDTGNLPASIGPYANLATFVGGARTCLGWRLGILEMQVVLSELISRFRFGFSPGQENDVTSRFAVTLLPYNMKTGKPSLRLLIRPVQDL
ncbi:cytochrome P450 [Marasmius fiardii PR-910]|nr:cytochrome P450 [Marasmius fiardii PR-910]